MMMHKQGMQSQQVSEQSNKKMRDKYQVLERISEGNFGTVYKVKELKTGMNDA
jgi:serine/threonine protein kinase